MEIYKFNINDNKEKVILDLIRVYKEYTELFENEAYCHFNIDAYDVIIFNKISESEYSCVCAYDVDEYGWPYDDDIKDCVEYFYETIMEIANC